MKIKLLLVGLGAVAAVGLLASVWWHGNSHGKRTVELQMANTVIQHQQSMRELADKLAEAEQKRERVVTRTIEVVRNVPDPTGCADSDITPELLELIRLH